MAKIAWERPISFGTRLRYLFEAAMVYLFVGIFAILPVDVASWLGGKIVRFIGPKLGVTKRAIKHVKFAMPEVSDVEAQKIAVDMWENIGRVIAEYPHLKTLMNRITVENEYRFDDVKASDKGAIMVSGHIGNWETCALVAKKNGLPIHLVYRKPNNMYVQKLLEYFRHSAGAASNIPKQIEGMRLIVKALKRGEIVGSLLDQKLNEGQALSFFGQEAMTTTVMPKLALKLDVPLYPVHVRRTKGAYFEAVVYPPLEVPKEGTQDEKTLQMMQNLNDMFEDWIRQAPAQWLWMHRRWTETSKKR